MNRALLKGEGKGPGENNLPKSNEYYSTDKKSSGKGKAENSHLIVPEVSSRFVSVKSFSFSNKLMWLKSLFGALSSRCFLASGMTI